MLEPRAVLTEPLAGNNLSVAFNPQALLQNANSAYSLTFCGGVLTGFSTLSLPNAQLSPFGLVVDGFLLPTANNVTVPNFNNTTIYCVTVSNNQVVSITATDSPLAPTPPVVTPARPDFVTPLGGTSSGGGSSSGPTQNPVTPPEGSEDPLSPKGIFEGANNLTLPDPNEPLVLDPQLGLNLQAGINNELPKEIPFLVGPLGGSSLGGIVFAQQGGQDTLGALGVGLVGTPFQISATGPSGLPITGQIGMQGVSTLTLDKNIENVGFFSIGFRN